MIKKAAECSETGLKRQINQDGILSLYNGQAGLFLVADGLGGHYRGELASGLAVGHMGNWWGRMEKYLGSIPFQEAVDTLEKSVKEANSKIYQAYGSLEGRGGTTLCLLFLCGNRFAVVNIGDSRLYRVQNNAFERMTRDDVWENQRRIQKTVSAEDMHRSIHYGRLTQALGVREQVFPSVRTGLLGGKSCFFLCSDGVYKYCSEKILGRALRQAAGFGNVEKMTEKIRRQVYQNGAKDNLSMIMVLTRSGHGDT